MTSGPEWIMVGFEGDGAGEGELSWGQKENWTTSVAHRTWLPQGGARPLPPGTTLADIADGISRLMKRYQPMRTRMRLRADGRPIQVVHGSGEVAVEIVDAKDDPGAVAEAVCERYRNTPLDFTAEWPLRMAVIRHNGQLTHMAELISHLAVDAAGAVVMMTGAATGHETPVTGMQPLAQAAWQRSPAGRRQNEAAMRYWETIYRTTDARRFDNRQPEHSPRYWHGEYDSPALLSAVRAIAASSGLGTSMVFLALFALALNDLNGINPVVIRPIVGNRFRPGLAGVVCTVAQAGVCVLDVAGTSFDEALRRAQRASMNAYKYAYFDDEDLIALRARIFAERGTTVDMGCFINDRHGVGGQRDTGPVLALGQIRETVHPSTFRWLEGQDGPSLEPLFVAIDDIPDAIQVSVHLDTRYVSLADGEALVRGMEATAVAACEPGTYRPPSRRTASAR